jgi:hypothetical protein
VLEGRNAERVKKAEKHGVGAIIKVQKSITSEMRSTMAKFLSKS